MPRTKKATNWTDEHAADLQKGFAELGWDQIFTTVQTTLGEGGFDPFVSEGTFGLEYVLWMGFLGLVGCALWPTAVARALAMESTSAVKRQFR